jgi:endoglucanase
MRQPLRLISVLAFSACLAAKAASAESLLSNADFETAFSGVDVGNWFSWGSVERSDWQAHDSSFSLLVKGSWCGLDYGGAEQKIPVVAGEVYQASFFSYWDNGFTAGYRTFDVDWRDANGNVLRTDSLILDLSSSESIWHGNGPYIVTAAVGAVEAEVRFSFSGVGGGGACYLDDIDFQEKAPSFFRCSGGEILDSDGQPFLIKALVLSGWYVPEAYMWKLNSVHTRHLFNYSSITRRIEEVLGAQDAQAFWNAYHENFLTEADVADMAAQGFNTFRMPFNYRLLSPQDSPGVYSEEGFQVLDQIIEWSKQYGLKVILDMHACPGGQASEHYADPEHTFWVWDTRITNWIEAGVACLWQDDADYFNRTGRTAAFNKQRTADIWQTIAARYKDEPAVIGYELINEPHLPDGVTSNDLRNLLIQISTAIRAVDTNHILFVEGDMFAEMIDGLLPPWDSNMAIAFHKYWRPVSYDQIQPYVDARAQYSIPLWMSESGENSNPWFHALKNLLETNNIGWSWWGFKKIDTIATAYSGELTPGFQYVINNFWDSPIDPVLARQGLMELADRLSTTNCDYEPGYYASLFDPQFGTTNKPVLTMSIPGTVNCVDYDQGNQGIAYNDTRYENPQWLGDGWNNGWIWRNDGVDISKTTYGCGYKVGWAESGEWLKYTVNIPVSGRYDITFHVATPNSGKTLQLLLDGKTLTSVLTVPNTGGWETWRTFTASRVSLPQGKHTITLKIVNGGFDISKMVFVKR